LLTCKVGNGIINCFDGKYDKYTLKKWDEEKRLICPDCGKLYEYCHGEVISPYFRHKEKSKECDEIFNEPETEEHIKGKQILYTWLLGLQDKGIVSDVKLEAYIPETRQRPDLYFIHNDKKFVLEYQCSPIATEYFERHRLYELAGIHDIWILGTDKYIEKSEFKKSFNKKVIEKNTDFYLDAEYKIFILNDTYKLNIELNYANKRIYHYYHKDKRKSIYSKLLSFEFDGYINRYMIGINGIEFRDGRFLLTDEALNYLKEYHEEKMKEELKLKQINKECESFLEKIFVHFKDRYDTKLNRMSLKYGFKCNKHYYKLDNIEKYPIIDFCKINYINNQPVSDLIFNFNMKDDYIDKIIDYLILDLQETIESNMELKIMREEFKNQRKNELINLKQQLSEFNDKPLYLLFLEDNQIIDKSIKFKVVHGYQDDIIKTAKIILENLNFIKLKGAKEYVLMIPRKKLRKSSSVSYPYYKVCNHKSSVKEDFNKLGLKFLEYNDLRR
jgi:hypothetical protein